MVGCELAKTFLTHAHAFVAIKRFAICLKARDAKYADEQTEQTILQSSDALLAQWLTSNLMVLFPFSFFKNLF
jgi:hypothetical protein